MRRVFYSCIILVVVVTGSLWWGHLLAEESRSFYERSQDIVAMLEEKRQATALTSLYGLREDWEETRELWAALMEHTSLELLSASCERAIVYLENGQYVETEAELAAIAKMFYDLGHAHLFKLANIF